MKNFLRVANYILTLSLPRENWEHPHSKNQFLLAFRESPQIIASYFIQYQGLCHHVSSLCNYILFLGSSKKVGCFQDLENPRGERTREHQMVFYSLSDFQMSFKQAVTLFQQNRLKRPGRAASFYKKHARTVVVQAGIAGGRQD